MEVNRGKGDHSEQRIACCVETRDVDQINPHVIRNQFVSLKPYVCHPMSNLALRR